MRRLFLAVLACLVLSTTSWAQRDSMVSIPASALTAGQQAVVESAALNTRIATYGKWVGLGKEVGEAVNGSLSAVTEQTSKFAETKVGHLTMWIVMWKVVGRDLLGLLFATALWVVITPILCTIMWKNGIAHNVVSTIHPDGTKQYNQTATNPELLACCGLCFLIMLAASAFAIF